jgi:hypothetical protein
VIKDIEIIPLDDPRMDAPRAEHEARVKQQIGRRIRFLEPPERTAWWQKNSPNEWLPTYGMLGTIVGMPKFGWIGAGPTVKWDEGHTSTLGSCSEFEYI